MKSLVVKSFLSGTSIFLFAMLLSVAGRAVGGNASIAQLALLFLSFAPGIIFSVVLILHAQSKGVVKNLLFFVVAVFLYFYMTVIVMGFSFLGRDFSIQFPLASTFGFVVLLLLHYFLLDRSTKLSSAIPLGIGLALLCSLLPVVADLYLTGSKFLNTLCLYSVYVFWQLSFGWVVVHVK